MAALSPRERADIEDELDRLRMMRVAEDGLAVGDPLPDFSLEDGAGRVWTSGELLDRGPLVLALFRGGWCPYCDLTMLALEDARPAIEALGATAVGVMPGGREVRSPSAAAERAIRYPLLADPANGFARMCGLTYELSPAHIRIHKDRGRDFPRPASASRSGTCRCLRCSSSSRARAWPGRSVTSIRRAGPIRRSCWPRSRRCAMRTRYRIGRHSAFLRRVRGAQGAITGSREIAHASRQDRHRHRLDQRHRARHCRGLRALGRQRRAERLRRRHADREDAIGDWRSAPTPRSSIRRPT